MDDDVLRRIVREAEPVASVYFGLTPDPGSEPELDLPLRWQRLADRLTHAGTDPETVAALARYGVPAPPSPTGLGLFASGGKLLLAVPMRGFDDADVARFAAPAYLLPLLAFRQDRPANMLIVTDRTGAQIVTSAPGGLTSHSVVVEGPDDEIERNAPGGWSQPRYQRRAEDSWRHNAARVAEVAARTLRKNQTTLLLVIGDVRAVQLLEAALPLGVRHAVTIRHLPGGRSPDGSESERQALVEDAAREHAEQETASLLDRFTEELAPGGLAVDGVDATMAALSAGRVATLLVTHDPNDERIAWFGPGPTDVYLRPDDPAAAGVRIQPGRLADIAVRAALCTDATVRVLAPGTPNAPADGLGALARFR
jgi:peptide subunit release factor 1 (eRF1)